MQRMWQRGPDGEIIRVRSEPEPSPTTAGRPAPADSTVRRRARFGLALRLGLRDTYDYLGAILVHSFLWTMVTGTAATAGQSLGLRWFAALPPLFAAVLAFLTGVVALVLVGSPLTAGVFRYARNAAARAEPELYDLAWGFRRALGKSLGLGAIQIAAGLLLAGNCYFYVTRSHPVAVVVGAVFGYLLAFWGVACLYQWPLLVEQELSPAAAVKKSALLVLDNFGFTALLAVFLAVLTAVLWVTVIGGTLLWAGGTAMFLTQATRELLRKYGVLGPDPTLDPIAEETHDLDR